LEITGKYRFDLEITGLLISLENKGCFGMSIAYMPMNNSHTEGKIKIIYLSFFLDRVLIIRDTVFNTVTKQARLTGKL